MRKFLLFLFGLTLSIGVMAQSTANYTFAYSYAGSLVDISSGATVLLTGTHDDDAGPVTNIGFDFVFMGVTYSQFSANSNGQIRLGSTSVGGFNISSYSASVPILAPMSGDNEINNGMTCKVTGSAPNRVLVIEWNQFYVSYINITGAGNMQALLYEGSGKIEYVYGEIYNSSSSSALRSIFISGSNTTTKSGSVTVAAIPTYESTATSPTSNTFAASVLIANLAGTAQGARTVYSFTPPAAPNPPTNLTFSPVGELGMTLNWEDASNETGYAVYKSTDGTTYTYLASVAANTVTYAATGLIPGTTYYWKVYSLNEGAQSSSLDGTQATNAPGSITSIVSGNWSETTTWSTGAVPTATDDVTIADAHTVIIDETGQTCYNLTVGQGASGILRFGTTAATFTVNGSVTVAANGTFDAGAAAGASLTHTLNIGGSTATAATTGNLVNNGTFDMYIGTSNGKATVAFFGIPNATISGTGTAADFYRLVLNKGAVTATATVTPPVLEIQSAFTVQGANTVGLVYTHTAGVLKIGGSFTQSNPLFTTLSYPIPSIGGLWLSNANFTVTALGGSPVLSGLFKITDGIYNVGTGTGNSFTMASGAIVNIAGGTINVAGRFAVVSSSNTINFNQSGGTLNVCNVSHSSSTYYSFDAGTSSSTIFVMSGGNIIVIKGSGSTFLGGYDYRGPLPTAAGVSITGGSLQIGSASTVAATTFKMLGCAPNTTIFATNNPSVTLAGSTTIWGDLTINGTGTFSLSTLWDINMKGMNATYPGNIVNSGILTLNSGSSQSLTFSSSVGNQSLSGSGTITGSAITQLIINNTFAGGTVTLPSGLTIKDGATLSGTLKLQNGILSAPSLTLGAGTTSGFNFFKGNGSLASAPTFTYGSGSINYTYNGTSMQVTGIELPATITGALTINNATGVTLNAALSAGTLALTSGKLTTTSTNLLTISGTTAGSVSGYSVSNYVNGPIARTLPASLATGTTYLFPVGKSAYKPLELVNPTTTGGTVVIDAEVFDADCGGTSGTNMGALNTDRYWKASIISGTNFANTTVRLTESGLTSNNGIGESATLTGAYDLISSAVPTATTIISDAITSLGYFVIGIKSVPMTYTSSTTTQTNTSAVPQGTTNAEVIGIQIVTTGNATPLSATSFTINANGTTSVSDISNARIFYTGTTNTFSAINQFGSAVASPTTTNFSITGTQTLAEGTNYFWVTFDISSAATQNNSVDAECSSVTVGGSPYSPSNNPPAGSRLILNQSVTGTGTATATWPVYRNWNYSTWECIYLQSELGASKDLTRIAFNKSSGTDVTGITPVTIYMKHTSATTLATGKYDLTGYTQVFTGTFPNTATSGWMEMVLNSAFSYNGTDNIQILIVKGYQYYTSSYPYYFGTIMATNRARQGYSDDEQPGLTGGLVDLTASTNVPNLRFNYTLPVPKSLTSITGNQASTNVVMTGSANQEILRLDFAVTGSTGTLNLNSIVVTSNNTSDADISNVKLFRTSTTTFSTANQVGTSQAFSGGTATFSSLSYDLPGSATTYLWVAYDISGSATINNTVDAKITVNSIDVAGSTYPASEIAPAGTRTIKGPLTGTKTIGTTGADYTSLTGATGLFADINALGLGSNLTVNIISDLTEDGTNALNQWAESGAGNYTLTIQPSEAVNKTISGAYAGGLIRLNGADRVTLDGNFSSAGTYLTFSNTSTSGSAVIMLSSLGASAGATNNTIKNCSIKAGSITATTYGIVIGGSTVGSVGADNDNNTIQNNSISKAYIGLWAQGSATTNPGLMDNLQVTGNSIGSATATDYIAHNGIMLANGTGCSVSQNTVFNVSMASSTPVGVTFGTGMISSTITRNNINNITATGTGGYGGRGIYVNTGNASSNLTIVNNMIHSIGGDGYSTFSGSSPVGIYFDGTTGGLNIYYNAVYMSGILTRSGTTLTAAILFNVSTITAIDLRNNIFQNSMNNTYSGSTAKNYAIYSSAPLGSFTTINYNDYYVSGTQGILGYLGGDQATLAAWKTATAQDVNSVSGDPKYVSATDLHIQIDQISPVNDAGTPIAGITTDYDGNTRSETTPDIGADEYTYVPPAVIDPTGVSAAAISSSQIDIAFTPNVTSNNVVIVWNLTGTFTVPSGTPALGGSLANGTVLSIGTTSPVSHTGLTPFTPYFYKAFSYNGALYSSGVAANATTPCANVSVFPFTESFDGTTFVPDCWTLTQVSGTGNWARSTSGSSPTTSPHSGPGMAYFNSYSFSSGVKSAIITPPIDLPADGYLVKFWMVRDAGYSSYADLVNVYYSTTASVSGATLLGTINRNKSMAPVETGADGWYQYSMTLPAGSTGSSRYVVFEGVSANGNNIFVDDININAAPTVPIFSITPTTKDFGSAVAGGSPTAAQTFTISNVGVGTLTIETGGITLTGTDPGQFVLVDENTYPIELTAEQTATVTVAFAPTSAGSKSANLQVVHNAAKSTALVPLTGTALPVGSLFESFEGTSFPPPAWSVDASTWTQSIFTAYDGTKSAYYYTSSIVSDKKLITPKVTISSGNVLTYYAKTGSGTAQTIQVRYSPDKTTWTDIGSPVTLTTSWTQYSVDLTTLAGNNYYLAFAASTTSSSVSFYVDYVMGPITAAPGCATIGAPDDAAVNVALNTTLTWSAGSTGGIPTGYKLYFGTDGGGTTTPTNIENGDLETSPYTPESLLEYSTTYYWKVVPTNAVGDATGCPIWSFTTGADPTITTFPHLESFDGVTFAPYGWTLTQVSGTGNWARSTSGSYPTTSPHSGLGMAYFNSYSFSSGVKSVIITPPIDLPADGYLVKFWMVRDAGYSSSADLVNVYYSTTASVSGATLLGTINRNKSMAPVETGADGWYQYSITLPVGSVGNSRFVIFEGVSANGNNIFVDDINIDVPPACPEPNELTATEITQNSANLAWTSTGTEWEYQIGPTGFEPDPSGTSTEDNPQPVSGLSAGTPYDFYVRNVCPNGEGGSMYSAWAGPSTFTTLCGIAETPFIEGFETDIFFPTCWSGTTTQPLWYRTTACGGYGLSGASAMADFYYDYSSGEDDMITLEFDASTLHLPVLKFDFAYATSYGAVDELDIYYSTDGGATYTLLLAMPGGPDGILNPFGIVESGLYVPLASEWSTQELALPTGTNMVKFTAISAYGNELYVDNVRVEGTPIPEDLLIENETIAHGESNCYNATQTITVEGLVVQSGGSATIIAGQNILFMPGTTVANGGYLHGYITTTGTYCGDAAKTIVTKTIEVAEVIPEMENGTFFKVYPNPTNDKFYLELDPAYQDAQTQVHIYGMVGGLIQKQEVTGSNRYEFSLGDKTPGIYFIRVMTGDRFETKKIVKK